ncbi:MAG: pyrroline-5-carboxylate reductase [Christensenellales bacterium]|jgi:pyrroline-5-carboxylate reductase|nr:pyrroline-5-carboxylate reductase [Clostridiales bacterium]
MYDIGFVGVGVMGGAILNQIIAKTPKDMDKLNPNRVLAYDIDKEKLDRFKNLGINVAQDISNVFLNCKTVVIGIKPQQYFDMIKTIKSFSCSTVITIMAGVTIKTIEKYFKNIEIIRLMPNLPVLIGKGVIAYCHNHKNIYLNKFLTLFNSCGKLIEVEENMFDVVTSISGSGPAYVAYFAKSMIDSAVAMGLDFNISKQLVLATVNGTSEYLTVCNEDIDNFISKVCSKGGTTIEAINSFKTEKLESIINNGMVKCKNRAKMLSNEIL